jgi:hypothetical protein
MEASGTAPRVGIARADAPDLERAFEGDRPAVTVALPLHPTDPNAAPRAEIAWGDLRRTLRTERDAPESALAAIDELVGDAHRFGVALVAVADPGGLRQAWHLDRPLARELGFVGALPRLGTVIDWKQAQLPYVVAIVDHAGADVYAVAPSGTARLETGSDPHDPQLRRNAPGGWSQRRFQQRAENRWRANADDAVEAITRAAQTVQSRFIALAGDVRSRALVRERLGSALQPQLRDISEEPGIDVGDLAESVVRLVDTVAAEDTVALVEKFKEERGQRDRAVAGPGGTLGALAAAAVDTLLVTDDADDERTAWIGRAPNVVATDPGSVRAMGDGDPVEARLADAAIHAALGTGAAVRVVPGLPVLDGGIGAILRAG